MKPKLFSLLLAFLSFHPPVLFPKEEKIEEQTIKDVYLASPDLSEDSILGCAVGLRPHRKSGVRLEAEYLDHQLIIHNYGYGGSGLTLCWGGAQEVLTILQKEAIENPLVKEQKRVAVLGAGVIGLTTAYELLSNGYEVHIYAEDFSPHLTSDVAAGIWSPPALPDSLSEEKHAQLTRMLHTSRERFMAATSPNPEFAGAKFVIGYVFKAKEPIHTPPTGLFHHEKTRQEAVCVHFDNGVMKSGHRKTELGIDGKLFMADIFAKVIDKGATIVQKSFKTPQDIMALDERIVINCTSLGSRELFNDHDLIPLRGHLIHLKRPAGVDYMLFQNCPEAKVWVSIYPWSDRLILGGLVEEGKEELEADPEIVSMLLENARACLSGES